MFQTAQLLLVAVSATVTPVQQRSGNLVDHPVYCGGVTDAATVDRYFAELRHTLAKTGPNRRFNVFVDDEFGVRSRRGRTIYFKVSDIHSVSPAYITIREWSEISRRGARSLENAGWRGCFMDLGKVWFEGSGESGFRLTLIARDMPWRRREKGDALP